MNSLNITLKMSQFQAQRSVLQTGGRWQHLAILLVALGILFAACPAYCTDYYVDPDGDDLNDGSIDYPFKTITKAVEMVSEGDNIFLRAGVHDYSATITISKNGTSDDPITLQNYMNESVILDFSSQPYGSSNRGIILSGDYWHLKGFTIQYAGDNGLNISGDYNIAEQIVARMNSDSGIQFGSPGSYNLVLNCDSYLNYDAPNNGENADGFASKSEDVGPGNIFRGCRAWNNADDGFDLYYTQTAIVFEDCWAFGNGVNRWGASPWNGDGNGFKLGASSGNHVLIRCVVYDQWHNGIDINGDTLPVEVYNCTVYDCGSTFYFDEPIASVLRNNISYQGSVNLEPEVDDQYNSWNPGFSVSGSDFVSLDPTGIDGPRESDGSLPELSFLHLASDSSLIDAGIDVGEPYEGDAPDLGAFEYMGDDPAPAAPENLAATGYDGSVELEWDDNSEPDLDGYNIYRSTTSGSGYSQLNGSLLSSSDYTDNTVTNGITYYYVATAVDVNSNESDYSNEDSATPTDTTPPSAPTGLSATGYDGSVGLEWDDNSEPDLDGYNVYRSTSLGGPYSGPLNGSLLDSSDYTDNTVTNGITYYYVVTAVDTASNESDDSSEVSATPSDTMPPAAPTGLSITPGDGTVSLDWDDNPESDLDGYNVYRSTTSGSGYSRLNSSLLSSSDYTDNTVTNGIAYYYVVTAVDTTSNESDDSSEVSALPSSTAGAMGTILREWWTGISGSSVSDLNSLPDFPDNPTGSNQLTSLEAPTDWTDSYGTLISGYLHPPTTGSYTFWIASDDNSELWLSTDGNPENASMIANVNGSTNPRQWDKYPAQQSDPVSLAAGQKYYIEVLHKEDTDSDNLAVAWQGPGISQQLIQGIYLSPWFIGLYGDSTDDGIVDLNDLSDFMTMWMEDDCAESSAWDLNGDCIVNFYEFAILAWNWLTEQDVTPPAAPTGLSATPDDGTVSLDWDDNSESDLDGYNIYRSTTPGSGYSRLNASLLSYSDYTDNTVTNGITYYYVVTAVDTSNNESSYSNEASATPTDTTPPSAPTGLSATPGDGTVSLDWDDNSESDLDGYNVYRSTTSGGPYDGPLNSLLLTDSEYPDYTVTNGITYYYVVTAVDTASNESDDSSEASATPSDTTPPSAPTGLSATPGDETVSLDWDDNSESDLDGYNVYRSTTSGGPYDGPLNSLLLTDSEYPDYTVTNGITYYYVVTAVDTASNESGDSNEASATPSEPVTSITIQEEETGFCSVDGTIDRNHTGYTGTGFANTTNANGTGIDYRINILTAGTYTFIWRYSNGSTSNRPADLIINSITEESGINFPLTTNWDTWTTTTSVNVTLTTGIKDVRLEATTINGLANIDRMEVTGPNLQVATCP